MVWWGLKWCGVVLIVDFLFSSIDIHSFGIQWFRKMCVKQTFLALFQNFLTPGWKFWHQHCWWCWWQISGMTPTLLLVSNTRVRAEASGVCHCLHHLTPTDGQICNLSLCRKLKLSSANPGKQNNLTIKGDSGDMKDVHNLVYVYLQFRCHGCPFSLVSAAGYIWSISAAYFSATKCLFTWGQEDLKRPNRSNKIEN